MPMIPKPMTDINSESAYEKLKFVEEHYNDLMAAYTDIMEHLKLPVMTETGGGGSGEECLHEVTEVTNPCPAYIQFYFHADIPLTGIHFAYKDSYGDYNVQDIYEWDNSGVAVGLRNILNKYNQSYRSNAISMDHHAYLHEYPMLPLPSDPSLVYAAVLVDKTTGELVEGVDKDTDIDGVTSYQTTYNDLTNAYDVKLALVDPSDYSFAPVILGDLFEQLVELRANMNADVYTANLPTPEELLRLLEVECDGYYLRGNKLNVSLLTPEERTRVQSNLHMATSDSIPPDNPYMYAINLFCHPSTINTSYSVKYSCIGNYSKGFISLGGPLTYGLTGGGCGEDRPVTYIRLFVNFTPSPYSESYTYFTTPNNGKSYDDSDTGVTVTPCTFKLIQSKEGIDRRL